MKLILRNITLGFIVAFMLLGSLGFTFSKITCPLGQRYVLGAEMPCCKKISTHCGEDHCIQYPEKDDRQKETFQITLDLDLITERINVWLGFNFSLACQSLSGYQLIPGDLFSQSTSHRANPPPLLSKPSLSFLQVFLI